MALYEHVLMARQDVTAQQVEALVEQYKTVIEAAGGQIVKNEYWGVKSLAYRIKKNRKAHFQFLGIDAPHTALNEIERQMGINEDVLRFMTIRVDAIEEGPSAMLRKRDDSERRDDDFGGGRPSRMPSGRAPRGDRPFGGDRPDRNEANEGV
ncbi:MAG: 30S ribosomal protein S6 [Beijerinckiaceae bacterium]